MDKLPPNPTRDEIDEYLATRKFIERMPPESSSGHNVRSLDGLIRCAQYYVAGTEPTTIFVMIPRDEPDSGSEVPAINLDIKAYYSGEALKAKLPLELYAQVRRALGFPEVDPKMPPTATLAKLADELMDTK